MKVDLVSVETESSLILRFFDFTPEQLRQLIVAFSTLSVGAKGLSFPLTLDAQVGDGLLVIHANVVAIDIGASVVGASIVWSLAPDGWMEVMERASNIEYDSPDTFQWLDQAGPVHVLLSASDQW